MSVLSSNKIFKTYQLFPKISFKAVFIIPGSNQV